MLKEMIGTGFSVTVLKDEIVAPCQPSGFPSGWVCVLLDVMIVTGWGTQRIFVRTSSDRTGGANSMARRAAGGLSPVFSFFLSLFLSVATFEI